MPDRVVASLVALVLAAPLAAHAVDPGSQLIGCDQADTRLTISTSSHLDPSCTWTRGVDVVASDVVLDCQGAHIVTADRRYGVLVTAPTDVALSNVVVRNCHVEGFLNNFHVEREGFRDLAAGAEYDHAFSNIVIEDSTSLNSRGVGVFVDGYVTGVTLRNLHVEGAGSAGIYLEAGSKDNVVEGSEIVGNGYSENGPAWQAFDLGGTNVWFSGPGREGLAIDGSRANRVTNNRFSGNSAGGIFLYKNCGEFVNQRPARWFERRYGADGNVIEGNTFVGERTGVWIASRMGENTLPMDCSDPAYLEGPGLRVVLDYAADDVVRGNVFQDVGYGVRVEDDRATVADNRFVAADPAAQAVVVGTRFRTPALGRPVDGTVLTGNQASIAGNPSPYRWVHGQTSTTFAGNTSGGRLVGFCEGVPPPTTPFIFVIAFVVAPADMPPTDPPPGPPPAEPAPPCPLGCASPAPAATSALQVRRIGTPPGDEGLRFEGRAPLPHPFAPALDPVAVGVGFRITDAAAATVLDVLVPGGAWDAGTRVGWRVVADGASWKYRNPRGDAPGGIMRVAIRDLSRRTPGLVEWRARARRGAFPVDPAALPLRALVVLDPPTAETGQCAEATFTSASCASDGRVLRCR